MKCEECVKLHDGEVVTEGDKGRDVDDVLGTVPEMGEELGGTRGEEPDEVRHQDIPRSGEVRRSTRQAPIREAEASPDGQVVLLLRGLDAEVAHEARAEKKRERVEELVNLNGD